MLHEVRSRSPLDMDTVNSSESDSVENDSKHLIEFDKAFKMAGEFGWFQKRLLILIILYQVVAVFHNLAITFVGLDPDWNCQSSNIAAGTFSSTMKSGTPDDLMNGSNTVNDDQQQKCAHYEANSVQCTTPVYTERFHSATQEFNLICSQSYKMSLTQSWYFFGFLVGSYVFGYVADKVGRRKPVLFFIVSLSIVQVLTAMAPSYSLFTLGRFLVGFINTGAITMYILICELIGPSQRSLLAVSTSAMYGLGFGCLAFSAYLIPYWRGVTFLSGILTIVFILYSKFIPESPRWLYITGRLSETKLALIKISSVNGLVLPSGFSLKPSSAEQGRDQQSPGLMDIFRHEKMSRRMILQMLEWFTVCMVYFGLSLGVGSFSDNLYFAFTLSGLVEVPSNFLALLTLEKIGRKWSNVGFLLVSGVTCLICSYVQFTGADSSGGGLKLALSLFGKFSIAATFTIIYTYTPELFPTEMRNFGMGIANVCARLGGIIAPIVILTDSHTAGLSMLIMGSLGTMTCLLCLYLPETLNETLPNTLAEL